MTVDNPFPEDPPQAGWLAAIGLAAVEVVPVVGPLVGALTAEAMRQAQWNRLAEWAAMTGARLQQLEDRGTHVDVSDGQFLAALSKLQRAADETADESKRQLLADVASRSGSWSPYPYDRVAEFVSLAADLTPAEIQIVAFCDAVRAPAGVQVLVTDGAGVDRERIYLVNNDQPIDLPSWIQQATGIPSNDAWRIFSAMGTRGVLQKESSRRFAGGMQRRFTTSFGREFVEFLRGDL